jgi:cytochrome P450
MSVTFKQLPGPKGLPIIGNLHQIKFDKLHAQLENYALEFGAVFKVILGPLKFTVVSKPEIIQKILRARPADFRRMSKMDRILKSEGVHGVFNAEGETWKVHRRIVNKSLDVKHQEQFFPVMMNITERLYKKMLTAANSNSSYNLQDDLSRFTVDVTTSLAFGFEMNTLEQKGDIIQDHMEKIFPMIFKRINDPIAFHKIYRSKKDRAYDHAIVEIEKHVDQFIENGRERLKNNPQLKEKPENFLDAILVAADEEQTFTNDEIKGNLLTLLLAGEDTTAHSLAWATFLICQNPHIQDKLQEEADSILGNDSYLKNYSKINDLNYTEGVINETLRLKSVAPLLFLEPTKDVVIDDYQFRKGANIVALTRFGGLTDDYFTNSEEFNPERWLKKESKCPVHNMEAFIPFGSGARFCPGKSLAVLEMKLVLSMIMKNFTVEMVTPQTEVEEIMAFTLMPGKFAVRLKKRKKNATEARSEKSHQLI